MAATGRSWRSWAERASWCDSRRSWRRDNSSCRRQFIKEVEGPDSVYRVTELIGTSSQSWESAARTAVQTAAKSLGDLRVAEGVEQGLTIENGKVTSYRVKLNVSFKYVPEASPSRKTATRKR